MEYSFDKVNHLLVLELLKLPVNINILSQILGEDNKGTRRMPEVPKGYAKIDHVLHLQSRQYSIYLKNIITKFLHGSILKLDNIRFLISKLPPFRFIPLLSSEKKKYIAFQQIRALDNYMSEYHKILTLQKQRMKSLYHKKRKLKEVKTISKINLKSRSWSI